MFYVCKLCPNRRFYIPIRSCLANCFLFAGRSLRWRNKVHAWRAPKRISSATGQRCYSEGRKKERERERVTRSAEPRALSQDGPPMTHIDNASHEPCPQYFRMCSASRAQPSLAQLSTRHLYAIPQHPYVRIQNTNNTQPCLHKVKKR